MFGHSNHSAFQPQGLRAEALGQNPQLAAGVWDKVEARGQESYGSWGRFKPRDSLRGTGEETLLLRG